MGSWSHRWCSCARITRERDRAEPPWGVHDWRLQGSPTRARPAGTPSRRSGNFWTKAAKVTLTEAWQATPNYGPRMMYSMATPYSGLRPLRAGTIAPAAGGGDSEGGVLGTRAPDTLRSQRLLGRGSCVCWNRSEEAEKLIRPTVEADRQVFGAEGQRNAAGAKRVGQRIGTSGPPGGGQRRLSAKPSISSAGFWVRAHQDTLRSNEQSRWAYCRRRNVTPKQVTCSVRRSRWNVRRLVREHPDTLLTIYNVANIMQWQHHPAEAEKNAPRVTRHAAPDSGSPITPIL